MKLPTLSDRMVFYVIGGAMLICFGLGWYVNGLRHSEQIAKLEKANATQRHAFEAIQRHQEQAYHSQLYTAQTEAQKQIEKINDRYINLLADAGRVLNESGAEAESKPDLRGAPAVAAGVQTGKCECSRSNGGSVQKVREQALTIARDCDITATYYNNLLKFYEHISSGNKND